MWTILISVLIVSDNPKVYKPPVAVSTQTVGVFQSQADCEAVADANRSKGNIDAYVPFYAARCVRIR